MRTVRIRGRTFLEKPEPVNYENLTVQRDVSDHINHILHMTLSWIDLTLEEMSTGLLNSYLGMWVGIYDILYAKLLCSNWEASHGAGTREAHLLFDILQGKYHDIMRIKGYTG